MNLRRSVGALLFVGCFLGVAGAADAQWYGWPRGYGYFGYTMPFYGSYWAPTYSYQYSYVMPISAYGSVLPWPANYNVLGGFGWGAAPYSYGGSTVQLSQVPRRRATLYPAIPFEPPPDQRRVRYDITVPYAHATVLIDGAKTRQTGPHRVFRTPPLEADKEYTTTVVVQWLDENEKLRSRERTFTVVAGDAIRHTFVE